MTAPSGKIKVVYVTSSQAKRDENSLFVQHCHLSDSMLVKDAFDFQLRTLSIPELLEVDLHAMVRAEVASAYNQIKVPCIVEHAGLIFDEFAATGYPGGLTKPMWNTLGSRFVTETHSNNRRATARAVVAYCDGTQVQTFVGETAGTLIDPPRGSRQFYWDTVFVPDDAGNLSTYAEIADDTARGLRFKVVELSQSTKAMLAFLEFRRKNQPALWPRLP